MASDFETIKTVQAGSEKIRIGLLGRGILASRSPWLHQQEAGANNLDLSYELFDFSQRGWRDDELATRLHGLKDAGFSGVNVTHPFKQLVISHLDDLSPSARELGAVNTVHFSDSGMIGHNTDVTGFAESVRRGLEGAQLDTVIQYGAGGAGSATAHALLKLGISNLTLVESDTFRATTLASHLRQAHPGADVSVSTPDAETFATADGIVNATPVGMAAHPGTPFDPEWLHSRQWVADIVYFPLETALLREASARGCRTLNGKGMVVFQAAGAFDIFTDVKADRTRMLSSFDAFAPALTA